MDVVSTIRYTMLGQLFSKKEAASHPKILQPQRPHSCFYPSWSSCSLFSASLFSATSPVTSPAPSASAGGSLLLGSPSPGSGSSSFSSFLSSTSTSTFSPLLLPFPFSPPTSPPSLSSYCVAREGMAAFAGEDIGDARGDTL